jgi:nucleoside-diphosphate-sugar epimerase
MRVLERIVMNDSHVVLGASGGIGRALVAELAREGRRTRAVSRHESSGSSGIEHVAADLSTLDGARRACAGAGVVFHAAQPPYHRWPEEFPALNAHIIQAASEAGAKLVMVDNLYMYGPTTGALVETLPRAATGRKGVVRAELERQLLDAHSSGSLRVAIGRLSDYYGPNGPNSTLTALVLEPAAEGKAMRWPGSTTAPRTLHFLPDAARGLIVLGDHDAADGEVWHLPAAPAITGAEFMALVSRCLPSPVKAGSIGTLAMRIGGLFSKEAKETVECMYQWTAPFVVDSSKFTAAFGPLAVTPHAEAIAATLAAAR